MDTNTLTTIATAAATTLTTLAPFAGLAWRYSSRVSSTIAALAAAVDLHSGHEKGVLLVMTAPTMSEGLSAIPLLRERGWAFREERPGSCEGDTFVPAGDAWLADVRAADIVLLQGYPAAEMAALARHRPFREALRSNAVVIMLTPAPGIRYDFEAWGPYAQGVTTALTAEEWVSKAFHRRREVAHLRGTESGGLAAARKARQG